LPRPAHVEPLALANVEHAAAGLGTRLHRTPTFSSAYLSRAAGVEVYLKAELFQKTGSFKPRGVLTRLDALSAEDRGRGVCAVSAGNHAAALAWAAARESIDCLVVMWEGASPTKMAAAHEYGASVDAEASGPTQAFSRLDEIRGDRVFVHPFDDPLVIAGQGTVGLEVVEDVPELDAIFVPTGGGGLVAGVAVAVKALRPSARVIAVEPELAPALGVALRAGRPEPVEPRSVADGLNAPFAGDLPVRVCHDLGVEHVTVDEAEIKQAFRVLYERAKLAAEPAAAAGVAALVCGRVDLGSARRVAIVVTGGNVGPEIASGILGSR
jgi:threonine dehydratase